jgi:hypothetical protein
LDLVDQLLPAPRVGEQQLAQLLASGVLHVGPLLGYLPPGCGGSRRHYRVVDEESEHDPFELYDVLERLRSILSTRSLDFINLCIGPAIPVDDNEVDPWTSVFDDYLSDGKVLAAIAAGNNGEADEALGYNRVQVPAGILAARA